jgi:hypothetical protein
MSMMKRFWEWLNGDIEIVTLKEIQRNHQPPGEQLVSTLTANVGWLSDDQLAHLMDVFEVEAVNRMAAYSYIDEVDTAYDRARH